MASETDISIRRQSWPGPFAETTDSEAYVYAALDPIVDKWRWDDPDHRHNLVRSLNTDQLSLWAVWNVDGQIENGGIAQAISNPYGELCEDAVTGFRDLALPEYADRLDKILACYERPISLIRRERCSMLERSVGLEDQRAGRFSDRQYVSELFTRCSRISEEAEDYYWKLKLSEPPLLDVLSRIVDSRRSAFFEGT